MVEGPRGINRLLELAGLSMEVLASFWAPRKGGETLLQKSLKDWPDIQKVQASIGVLGTRQGQREDLSWTLLCVAGGSAKQPGLFSPIAKLLGTLKLSVLLDPLKGPCVKAGSVSRLLKQHPGQTIISHLALQDVRKVALCWGRALVSSWPLRGPHLPCAGWPADCRLGQSQRSPNGFGHSSSATSVSQRDS